MAELEADGFRPSDDVTVTVGGDDGGYGMSAVHASGSRTWYYASDEARSTRTECTR